MGKPTYSIEQKKLHEEHMSFMKLLALGTLEIAEGKFVSEDAFLAEMDKEIKVASS